MYRSIWLSFALAIALLALPRVAASQEHPPEHKPACPAGQECPMAPDHEAMRARHEEMMRLHEQSSARLQELQDRMHAATGDSKVDAIAALLDEMLAQQRAMHEMMMGEHPMMHEDDRKPEVMEDEKPDDAD